MTIRIRDLEFRASALIDTGFAGGVVLPAHYLGGEYIPDFEDGWVLADRSEVRVPSYLGRVQLGRFPEVSATITCLGDDVLIGIEVLRHFAVLLDHGQRVIVIES